MHIFAILIPIVDLVVDLRELSVGVIYRIVAICNAFIKETKSWPGGKGAHREVLDRPEQQSALKGSCSFLQSLMNNRRLSLVGQCRWWNLQMQSVIAACS